MVLNLNKSVNCFSGSSGLVSQAVPNFLYVGSHCPRSSWFMSTCKTDAAVAVI